ncbi:hypothetical protein [Sutcliffiella horikoshii]|uniref:hypothetical protein n=1 Tax=Sutcliffiella horikoshii TaxID=79883 RepID=UPI001F1D189C|nr:hypothetical protein [Sutcliffiella horikoshii]MCG1022634.1 hypothetical protein [Sutcliffiella horikoshii]
MLFLRGANRKLYTFVDEELTTVACSAWCKTSSGRSVGGIACSIMRNLEYPPKDKRTPEAYGDMALKIYLVKNYPQISFT